MLYLGPVDSVSTQLDWETETRGLVNHGWILPVPFRTASIGETAQPSVTSMPRAHDADDVVILPAARIRFTYLHVPNVLTYLNLTHSPRTCRPPASSYNARSWVVSSVYT